MEDAYLERWNSFFSIFNKQSSTKLLSRIPININATNNNFTVKFVVDISGCNIQVNEIIGSDYLKAFHNFIDMNLLTSINILYNNIKILSGNVFYTIPSINIKERPHTDVFHKLQYLQSKNNGELTNVNYTTSLNLIFILRGIVKINKKRKTIGRKNKKTLKNNNYNKKNKYEINEKRGGEEEKVEEED